jgi:aminoglycoside phosphotransferase (APT) family kinase protein
MIRQEEIAPLLASVRSTVAGILKPDLKSDKGRAVADSLLLVLDRVITDINSGDAIATPQLPIWDGLRSDLGKLGVSVDTVAVAAPTGFLGALDGLQKDMNNIQQALNNDAALALLVDRLKSADPVTANWLHRAATTLAKLHDASEPLVPETSVQQQAAPDTAGEERRLRAALSAYLTARFPQFTAEPITSMRLVPGGNVKQTAILALVKNDVLPSNIVLRLDLANSITGTSVKDEYPYIEQTFRLGLKVPQPLLLETDASILGGSFMLMSEVTQVTPSGTYFPEDRLREPSKVGPDFGKEVAVTLAKLHSGTRVTDPQSLPDYTRQAQESFAVWRTLPKPPLSLAFELSLAWMLSHPPGSDRPYCVVHGDFGTHNILVRDGHFASLVDWELAHVGDPAEDIAQCRMMLLPGIMEWNDFVREYVAAGGDPRACDEEAVAYFCVALFFKHALFGLTMRKSFLSGERTDIGSASLISYYADRVFQYQARALRIAVEAGR